MSLRSKLDVHPFEGYIVHTVDVNDAAMHGAVSGTTGSSRTAEKERHLQQLQPQQHQRKMQTPLKKLVTLKERVRVEQQPVLSVDGVCIVHLHHHPHVLLLKSTTEHNSDAVGGRAVAPMQSNVEVSYSLPGGRCRSGEPGETCLLRKLGRKLLNEPKLSISSPGASMSQRMGGSGTGSMSDALGMNEMDVLHGASSATAGHTILDVTAGASASSAALPAMANSTASSSFNASAVTNATKAGMVFRVGDVLARWYRPNFTPLMYPYIPPHVTVDSIKEIRTVFVVHMEPVAYLNMVQGDVELVAAPLFDLHDNASKYGPVIAALPTLLSRVVINFCGSAYEV